jgi:hypothetical protein
VSSVKQLCLYLSRKRRVLSGTDVFEGRKKNQTWRKLNNEELHILPASSIINRIARLRRVS